MITPVASRPDNGALQVTEPRPIAAQTDPRRDSIERDLAKYSYFSPVTRIDVETHTAVLQYRDSATGDVERQYPSKERLKAYGGSGPGVGALAAQDSAGAEGDEPEWAIADEPKPVALTA